MSEDYLHTWTQAVAAAAREGKDALWELEVAIRREYGGKRIYLRKTPRAEQGCTDRAAINRWQTSLKA